MSAVAHGFKGPFCNWPRAYRAAAVERAQAPVVAEIQASGTSSLREIAAGLNVRGIKTAQGKVWSAMQVKRVLERSCAREG